MGLLLAYSMFVGLLSAFIILFITKIGLRDWVQVHGSELINKLFSCQFCLSFWVGVLISCILLIFITFTGGYLQPLYIFIPICSTPITRMIL
jgi:hypothetical protein